MLGCRDFTVIFVAANSTLHGPWGESRSYPPVVGRKAPSRMGYLTKRTRNLRARSLNAASPPSRMSHTAFRMTADSRPPVV